MLDLSFRMILLNVLTCLLFMAMPIRGKLNKFEFAAIKIFPDISGHGIKVHIDTQANHYDVILEAQPDIFSNDFVIDDGTFQYNSRDVVSYSGSIEGKLGSHVIASVANSRFEGTLFFNGTIDALHVEDGSYLEEVDCAKDPFYARDHPQYCTILYHGSDDDNRPHLHHEFDESNKVKRSVDENLDRANGMCGWTNPKIAAKLYEWNPTPGIDEYEAPKIRERRAADSKPKICNLNMQIDHTTWSQYMSDFKNNEQMARTAVTRLIADLVSQVTTIYRQQEFYTDDRTIDKMTGFAFQVKRIRIYKKDEVCSANQKDATLKQLCPDFIDSDAFLKINSEMNHDAYCLAYIISHRQFTGGVMGLAWLGYPSGYVGGVCQRQTRVSGGQKASYNTGIITSNNQGSRVSKRSLMLTLAHEIGHNFGSPHDSSSECVPTGSQGYYIMYPYVNPGDKANNDKFSSCSRNKMALNLDAIVQGRKTNCFTDKVAAMCGNQVVEDGEDCDCGLNAEECKAFGDNCCIPADAAVNSCKLTPNAKCSISKGPCCDPEKCDFIPKSANQLCSIAGECADQSLCDGRSAFCPAPPQKPNATRCASNTRRCFNGECSQSICEEIGYEGCQEPMVKGVDSSSYCYLSCRPPGANKACISSQTIGSDDKMKELLQLINNGNPLSLPPGSPCDEFRGVCDPLRRCRQVNTQGPLAKMFLALTGKGEVETAGDWLVKYWWVVAISAVAFIAISFCLLKYCSDLLPTSNPKLEGGLTASQALHSFTTTIRRRRRGDQRVPTNAPPF